MWFKVSDKLHSDPKWLALTPRSQSLWTTAGSWSGDQLTDGHVPRHVLRTFHRTPRDAQELVDAGLWDEGEGGWTFHDWLDYQPSREQVLAEREKAKERQQKARDKAREKRDRHAVSHGVTSPVSHGGSHGPPDPTRPDPTISSTHLGIEGGGGLRDPRKCAPHQNVDNPGPCGACADARRRHETQEAQKAKDQEAHREAERQRRLACPYCNDDGWRDTINGTVTRCTHEPEPQENALQDDRIDT